MYSDKRRSHRELAALGAIARREARVYLNTVTLSRALGKNRGEVRAAIAATLQLIDVAARALLVAGA
jgi:hypothetical protein